MMRQAPLDLYSRNDEVKYLPFCSLISKACALVDLVVNMVQARIILVIYILSRSGAAALDEVYQILTYSLNSCNVCSCHSIVYSKIYSAVWSSIIILITGQSCHQFFSHNLRMILDGMWVGIIVHITTVQ